MPAPWQRRVGVVGRMPDGSRIPAVTTDSRGPRPHRTAHVPADIESGDGSPSGGATSGSCSVGATGPPW